MRDLFFLILHAHKCLAVLFSLVAREKILSLDRPAFALEILIFRKCMITVAFWKSHIFMNKAETLSVSICVYKPQVTGDSVQIFLRLHDIIE